MILLHGILEDDPMNLVRTELEKAGARYSFLDRHKIFDMTIESMYSPDSPAKTIIHSPGVTIDLSEVKAVYIRPYDFREFPEAEGKSPDDPLIRSAAGFDAHLTASLDASNALVVNRSMPSATNNSKPYQLTVIKEAGLKVPETFITNEPANAREFLSKSRPSIYKSISGVRSIVQQVSDRQMEYLDDVQWCPTLFQKYIKGINYRVHVIKNDVYTLRIESDSIDYRYGEVRMFIEDLPAGIAQKCRHLTALLGLTFSGIDLIRTPDEEWYCLEVNPSPGYSYFQQISGLPLSTLLARELMRADQLK